VRPQEDEPKSTYSPGVKGTAVGFRGERAGTVGVRNKGDKRGQDWGRAGSGGRGHPGHLRLNT